MGETPLSDHDFRDGSKADMAACPINVCLPPEETSFSTISRPNNHRGRQRLASGHPERKMDLTFKPTVTGGSKRRSARPHLGHPRVISRLTHYVYPFSFR